MVPIFRKHGNAPFTRMFWLVQLRRSVMACPIPRDAPATRATFPFKELLTILFV
jgi:hypothetical protein